MLQHEFVFYKTTKGEDITNALTTRKSSTKSQFTRYPKTYPAIKVSLTFYRVNPLATFHGIKALLFLFRIFLFVLGDFGLLVGVFFGVRHIHHK